MKNTTTMKRGLFIAALLLLSVSSIAAADFDHAIINSEKWTDVYSGLLYANLEGIGSDFIVSTPHGATVLNGINEENSIGIFSSDDRPYVFNYQNLVEARGFEVVDEIESDNFNLELVDELTSVNNFIIVGDSFGYNALAVAPYAIQTNAWVFLANKNNIFQIDAILSRKNVNNIMLYGFVDQEVTDTLQKYNPKIINTGNRFEDNIEIVEEFLKVNPTKQVILTNGEFVEQEIIGGKEPILFTGKENVPDQISDYLKNSDIEVGVLIGNDLVGAATNIRSSTGISVMVKFARGARVPTSGVSAVEGLDLFPVPTPNLKLTIHSVKYNRAKSQLEVTYFSESNVPLYLKGTITIDANGQREKAGDTEAIFLAPGDYKTITYIMQIDAVEGITAEIFTLYGETPLAMDRIISGTIEVEVVDVIDSCVLSEENIKYVKYSSSKQQIIVQIENPHDIDCWVDLEIEDITLGYSKQTIAPEGSTRILAKKTKKIFIDQELSESDLENNQEVNLAVYSGEREDSLVHVLRGKFPLEKESVGFITYAIIVLIILIIGLIIFIIIIKKRQNEDDYY